MDPTVTQVTPLCNPENTDTPKNVSMSAPDPERGQDVQKTEFKSRNDWVYTDCLNQSV